MKKIGIISEFKDKKCVNYGNSFQAYALNKYLNNYLNNSKEDKE